MIRIVDASATGAVLLAETEAPWVNEQTDGWDLLAPVILPFEIGNIFWKRLRRAVATEADTIMTVWRAWSQSIPVQLATPDLLGTLRLARATGLTYYDASYLWLAQDRSADLISLDTQLVRVARSLGLHAPSPHTTPRARN